MIFRADIEIRRHDGNAVDRLLGEIADLYEQVYAEPPYHGGPLFSRERFLERTNRQRRADGFELVTVRAGSALVGFSFGFTFAPGRWWRGQTLPEPPPEIVNASKFAVIELVVDQGWRGGGLGRELLTRLLADRPETYAMLLAEPTAPARQIYQRWGWRHVADVRPSTDAPRMHALVLPLRPAANT